MSWINAYLPTTAAATIYTVLDTLAAVKQPGETRTIAQRRADALTDLFTQMLTTGTTPTGPLPVLQHQRATITATIPLTALVGLQPGAGELDTYGYVPLSQILDTAEQGAHIQVMITDPATEEALTRLYDWKPHTFDTHPPAPQPPARAGQPACLA